MNALLLPEGTNPEAVLLAELRIEYGLGGIRRWVQVGLRQRTDESLDARWSISDIIVGEGFSHSHLP